MPSQSESFEIHNASLQRNSSSAHSANKKKPRKKKNVKKTDILWQFPWKIFDLFHSLRKCSMTWNPRCSRLLQMFSNHNETPLFHFKLFFLNRLLIWHSPLRIWSFRFIPVNKCFWVNFTGVFTVCFEANDLIWEMSKWKSFDFAALVFGISSTRLQMQPNTNKFHSINRRSVSSKQSFNTMPFEIEIHELFSIG